MGKVEKVEVVEGDEGDMTESKIKNKNPVEKQTTVFCKAVGFEVTLLPSKEFCRRVCGTQSELCPQIIFTKER